MTKIPWSTYVAAVINNPNSDPGAYLCDEENDGFKGSVYSQEANPQNGGQMSEYDFPPYEEELVPLENDTQVAQVVLNRCKRFESNFPYETGLMVDYYNGQFDTAHTSFWVMIAKWMAAKFVTESSRCPSCGRRGFLKYTAQTDTSGIYPNFMDEDGNYGTMQCDNCGYTGPVKFYFWGWGGSVGFAKHDMSTIERDNTPRSKGQRHENFKMYTYDSETKEKNVFIETDVTEDVYWWSTYQIVDYVDKNYGNNTFICSDTGIVTCTFPKLGPDWGTSRTIELYYFADARLRYWHHYYGPTVNVYGEATHDISFAPFEWRLNDGYVAYMNIFQVLWIEDKNGDKICGELPVQKHQLKSGYIQEPYLALRLYKQVDSFSEVTAADAAVWDGDGPTSGGDPLSSSPGCKSFPSSTCSLFVQKLSRGYLVGFHGYKSYYVDGNQNVTEIGDNTKNFRMNYLKDISKAKG